MDSLAKVDIELIFQGLRYSFWVQKESPSWYSLGLKCSIWKTSVEVRLLADNGFLVSLNCHTYVIYANLTSAGLKICVDGEEHQFEKAYNPSLLKAGMSGKLVKLLVQSGSHIQKNQPYAEVEVMKMLLTLISPESGMVNFSVSEGSLLQSDTLIGNLELDDPKKIRKTIDFIGTFPLIGKPHNTSQSLKTRIEDSIRQLRQMISGYTFSTEPLLIRRKISDMVICLRDPMMPVYEFYEAFGIIHEKIPESVSRKLKTLVKEYCQNSTSNLFPWETRTMFPVKEIEETLKNQSKKIEKFESPISLLTVLKNWNGGAGGFAAGVFLSLLENFFQIESFFSDNSPEKTITKLKKQFKDSEEIVNILFAHSRLEYRIPVVLEM
jgi:acetyl-CoA carboxylase/biotin carboxylase 1